MNRDRNDIAEIEEDKKQEALDHYAEVLEQSNTEKEKIEAAAVKAADCMGNAEHKGSDQDLICQILIDDCIPELMDIVANGCNIEDPSLSEAAESVRQVKRLVNMVKLSLNDHFLNGGEA